MGKHKHNLKLDYWLPFLYSITHVLQCIVIIVPLVLRSCWLRHHLMLSSVVLVAVLTFERRTSEKHLYPQCTGTL